MRRTRRSRAPVEDTPLADYDDAMRRLHLAQQREEATPGIADDPHRAARAAPPRPYRQARGP